MKILETGSGPAQQTPESKDREEARQHLTKELNQLLRRIRSYSNEVEWVAALIEGVSRFASTSAVFLVQENSLRLRAQNGLDCPADLTVPLPSAAAFATVVQSKDPVVALCTPSEVGVALGKNGRSKRVHIFPVLNGARVAAVIFASGDAQVDVNGIELLASVASMALERQANRSLHTQIETPKAPPADVPPPGGSGKAQSKPKITLAPWARLNAEERSLHSRAQRFARVKVAEMELAKPEACRAGRKDGNFYLFLKREIDLARDSFRKQFMTAPGMVDYLHLELVNTAAGGDEQKLGADYPGQLV